MGDIIFGYGSIMHATSLRATAASGGGAGEPPLTVLARLSKGKHVVDVYTAADPNAGPLPRPRTRLNSSPQCVCDGAPCGC